ncbi:MAG: magnesium transporter [Bacteroidales bacterium]|jgi:magnesium transporter|nr:magnesium transporter [Bacteroidales bacterium]
MAKLSTYKNVIKRYLDLLSQGEKVEFSKSLMQKAHAADLAELIANLSDEKQVTVFENLETERQSEVFSELPEVVQEELAHEIDAVSLVDLFKTLPLDEAADLLAIVEEEDKEVLLHSLTLSKRSKLERLMLYGQESAGGIMTPIIFIVKKEQTVAGLIEILRKHKDEDQIFLNIFVVDEQQKLIGSIPLQDIVVADPESQIGSIMQVDPISVSVHDDQEYVAHIVRKYSLLVVPVVDENGKLVGRVTPDDILEVLQEEAEEDAYKMAGLDAEEVKIDSGLEVARLRLPWLLMCLLGSMVSAGIIHSYGNLLSKGVGLIIFLPAICAMGGNSGLQTSTVTIRNLAYGSVFYKNLRKVIRRELLCGILIGIVCGTTVGCVGGAWLRGGIFGLIIGCAMVLTVLISTCTGLLFPLFFNKIGIDPAVASGPLITTLNDATSTFTYLTTAYFLFNLFQL